MGTHHFWSQLGPAVSFWAQDPGEERTVYRKDIQILRGIAYSLSCFTTSRRVNLRVAFLVWMSSSSSAVISWRRRTIRKVILHFSRNAQ